MIILKTLIIISLLGGLVAIYREIEGVYRSYKFKRQYLEFLKVASKFERELESKFKKPVTKKMTKKAKKA